MFKNKINIKQIIGTISTLAFVGSITLGVVSCKVASEEIEKTDLKKIIKNNEVMGVLANSPNEVLQQIAKLNPNLSIKDVEIKDFQAAVEGENGSAKIIAKENTRYIGTVDITIIKLSEKININEVIKNNIVIGDEANTANEVLQQIAKLNPDLSIEDVEIKDFQAATKVEDGSAKIIAIENSKYTDEVDITIIKLAETVQEKIVNTINQSNYDITVSFKYLVADFKNDINANFIKKTLPEDLKNEFDNDSFVLQTVTDTNNEDLTDKNFETAGTFSAKITYNYDEIKEQTTNLSIVVEEAELNDKFELNDGNVNALIQATNGKLYAGTDNGNVWEINLITNEKINKYQLNNEHVYNLVQATNGKLYAGTIKASIWEIDLEKEETTNVLTDETWVNSDNHDVTSLIAGSDGYLYAGTAVGNVWQINLSEDITKPTKYRLEDWSFISTLVQATNGKLYAGSGEGNIWEIDFTNNNVIVPKYRTPNKTNLIFDMKEDSNNNLILTINNRIHQFNISTNQMTELLKLEEGNIHALMQGSNQELYFATENGNAYEFDLITNSIKNKYQINVTAYSLTIINKKLYAGTETGIWELGIV